MDIADRLAEEGYRITRVEKGKRPLPVIDLNLSNGPADLTEHTLSIQLNLEPYLRQDALNARVILTGLLSQLNGKGYGVGRRGEFIVRVFIPDLDGDYLRPDQGDESPGSDTLDDQPREIVMRAIAARRGATVFRNAELSRFNQRYAISGCALVDVLEAAHIRPYRCESDNNPKNGILLRSDLHTLFDLDFLAINPADQTIAIHSSVEENQYRQFHGRAVMRPVQGFDFPAIRQRWAIFQARDAAE